MSRKNINFDDRKNQESHFYKTKKAFQIDDIGVNKLLASKKEPYGTKQGHTLLDIMIMMLLDHYV